MLPDLWRILDRRVRAVRDPLPHVSERDAVAELEAGIQHHLDADEWFHDAPVFLEGERATASALQAAELEARHSVMFAHVLWELCLDGALVLHEGEAQVREELREGLDACSGLLPAAAHRHHFARVARTEDDRARFDERLERVSRDLVVGSWALGYASGAGLAVRVDGMRRRLNLLPMGERDVGALARVAEARLADARGVVKTILASPPVHRIAAS
jgi:hypothetical protein